MRTAILHETSTHQTAAVSPDMAASMVHTSGVVMTYRADAYASVHYWQDMKGGRTIAIATLTLGHGCGRLHVECGTRRTAKKIVDGLFRPIPIAA